MKSTPREVLLDRYPELRLISRYVRQDEVPLLGSGSEGQLVSRAPCANPACDMDGELECRCRLVRYCGSKCQGIHAASHAKDCALSPPPPPPLSTISPLPLEEHSTLLWETIPAISLVNPDKQDLPDLLRLGFADLGDVRDLLTTLSKLPDDYTGKVIVLLNHEDSEKTVRNFLVLEMLRLYGAAAADAIVALFYSAGMTQAQSLACKAAAFSALDRSGYLDRQPGEYTSLRDLPEEGFKQGGGRSSLAAAMSDRSWSLLLRYLVTRLRPGEVVYYQTRGRGERLKWVDEHLQHVPAYRNARHAFSCDNGLLLPFSMTRGMQYDAGNSFLLYPDEGGTSFRWGQDQMMDPLVGWSLREVLKSGAAAGVAADDLYGALFFHVKEIIAKAVAALERCQVAIRITNFSIEHLGILLGMAPAPAPKFHAIYIADEYYGLVGRVIAICAEHIAKGGTLVTLCRMWFEQQRCPHQSKVDALGYDICDAMGYTEVNLNTVFEEAFRKRGDEFRGLKVSVGIESGGYCSDTSGAFRRYVESKGVAAEAAEAGLRMREENRIVAPRIGLPVGAAMSACPAEFATPAEVECHRMHCRVYMDRFAEWEPIRNQKKC